MSDDAPGTEHGSGGTTAADRRTAMRFVLGRPGWRVDPDSGRPGAARVVIATPLSGRDGSRLWHVSRGQQGVVVVDAASGVRLCAVATMRDALVDLWEAVTAAPRD